MDKGVTRRSFLKAAMAGVVSLVLSACQRILPSPTPVPTYTPPTPTTPVSLSRVVIVKDKDLPSLMRKAVEALGGMGSLIKPADRVLVKPNWVVSSVPAGTPSLESLGTITKVDLVLAIVEECLKAGASQVTVAEGGQARLITYEEVEEASGHRGLAVAAKVAELNRRYGGKVRLVCTNSESSYFYLAPSSTSLEEVALPPWSLESDVVISIPVLKTHHSTATTLSLKCLFGFAPFEFYGNPRVKCHLAEKGVEQVFLSPTAHSVARESRAQIRQVACEEHNPRLLFSREKRAS